MPTYKSQELLTKLVKQQFGYLTWYSNIRPTANPNRYNPRGKFWYQETNLELEGLEADLFCPQIRLAIEFDGVGHLRPNDFFHGTKVEQNWWQRLLGIQPPIDTAARDQKFRDQAQRDTRKGTLLFEQGVELIRVDHHHRDLAHLEDLMRRIADRGLQVLPKVYEVTNTQTYETAALRTQLTRDRMRLRPISDTDLAEWQRLLKPKRIKRGGK